MAYLRNRGRVAAVETASTVQPVYTGMYIEQLISWVVSAERLECAALDCVFSPSDAFFFPE